MALLNFRLECVSWASIDTNLYIKNYHLEGVQVNLQSKWYLSI